MVALTLAAVACTQDPPESGRRAPTIVLEPCAAPIPDGRCGVLQVPEDRADPSSPMIDLQIVVAPATSRHPAPDPVVLLAGGPGQGAAALAGLVAGRLDAVRADRDLVFVDLRGTGGSRPLACDFEDPEDIHALLSADFDATRVDACLAQYRDSYGEIDLAQYITDVQIDDLDAVREALGYEQVNLLGISYGTREALVYMRRHPQRVRSAVLDGVAPPQLSVSLEAPANAEQALRAVLDDCRAQPGCDAAFPGLERKLDAVQQRLSEGRTLYEVVHPRTGQIERVDVTVVGFMGALRMALYGGESSALIPLVIDRAHAGDFAPAAALLLRVATVSKTLSMGLYLSVACAEDLGDNDEAHRRQATAGLTYFDTLPLAQLEQACARWPHATLAPEFFAPVHSDVPTLLLSGRYDPVTPPAMAARAAEGLSHARHVIVDAAHHGIWSQGCTPALLAEFYASADPAALDVGCYDQLVHPPFFLSPAGPRALPPIAEATPAITGLAQGEAPDQEHAP